MPVYAVKVLGVEFFPPGATELGFKMDAPDYATAVCKVASYLDDEMVPYRSFAGSLELGR